MLPRRLSTIVQLPERQRFSVLGEGLELLADNVATLESDARTLGESRHDRSAAVLRCSAEEEAAKVLILLDLARAGWKDHSAVKACLSRFYSHLARGLYIEAYGGSPADLAEVRRHLDFWRQEYYLDGPMDVDWIFGNEVLARREERLYVDYIEDEHRDRRWTGPLDRTQAFDTPFSHPAPPSTVVELVAAMHRIGLLAQQGLAATCDIWDGVAVDDTMHWSDLRPLNVAVLHELQPSGWASEEDIEGVHYVLEHWLFPLTTLDLALAKVDIADLQQARERRLAHEMDW